MDQSGQSLVNLGSMDCWSYQLIRTYRSFFMYWWDQSGQTIVHWVKSFHSVRLRLIISAYQYVWVDFSWPDGPVWTVLGPSRQYGWLTVSSYQYVWVIFHLLMGPVWTVLGPSRVHGPLGYILPFSMVKADHISLSVCMGRCFMAWWSSLDSPWSFQAVRMADRTSLYVRTGHF